MLGIIGGSGLYDMEGLEITERVLVSTPFGFPSDALVRGVLEGQEIVFLARHGRGHRLTPTDLPYRANIYALKAIGVTHLVTVSSVGSLREDLPPRAVVLPDQIIDRTVCRDRTFFDQGVVAHVGLAEPYCGLLRTSLMKAGNAAGEAVMEGGTYVCIEGPQFSTIAESKLYRSWGCSIIGMTAMPEARLAREAELCYATLAMVTDYDVWHEHEEAVNVELVIANLHHNAEVAKRILRALAVSGLNERSCGCRDALASAIVTNPAAISIDARRRIGVIADRYLSPHGE